jgi:hypothetical protein
MMQQMQEYNKCDEREQLTWLCNKSEMGGNRCERCNKCGQGCNKCEGNVPHNALRSGMHLVYVHNLPDMIWLTLSENEVSGYFLPPQVQTLL